MELCEGAFIKLLCADDLIHESLLSEKLQLWSSIGGQPGTDGYAFCGHAWQDDRIFIKDIMRVVWWMERKHAVFGVYERLFRAPLANLIAAVLMRPGEDLIRPFCLYD